MHLYQLHEGHQESSFVVISRKRRRDGWRSVCSRVAGSSIQFSPCIYISLVISPMVRRLLLDMAQENIYATRVCIMKKTWSWLYESPSKRLVVWWTVGIDMYDKIVCLARGNSTISNTNVDVYPQVKWKEESPFTDPFSLLFFFLFLSCNVACTTRIDIIRHAYKQYYKQIVRA